jgi:glutathione S-transferase
MITLLIKDIPFDITYIDINDPPDWFLDISPFGKVPVLRTNHSVLFESSVINEYLDEITPPSMLPEDPLQKAQNRAWIEYGSSLNFAQHDLYWSKEQQEFQKNLQDIRRRLERLEQQLTQTPYYNGTQLSLVDVAYAPLLMRFRLIEGLHSSGIINNLPHLQSWTEELCSLDSVQKSVVPEFNQLYIGAIKKADGYMSQFLA